MISNRLRKKSKSYFFTISGYFFIKIIFFLIFVGFLFSLIPQITAYFPIKAVKVYGIQHANQKMIQQKLIPYVNKSFFSIDVDTIKDCLLQSPWISKASVQRIWPDQIVISVVEKIPVARWNETSLICSNGELFSPEQITFPPGLAELVGPSGQQLALLQYYKKLNSLFIPLHLKISRLELASFHSFLLTFSNGMKLSVGNKDILTRLSHFVKVYPKILNQKNDEIEYIDLRYSNGLAVKWRTIA